VLTRRQGNSVVVVVGVVLALCLASSAVCVASQSFMLSLPLPFGYLMTMCGVFTTTPSFQMGLTWMSPFFSAAIPPFGGPGGGCLTVPWLPVLPQRGALLTP